MSNVKNKIDDARRTGTLKFDTVRGLLGGVDEFSNTEGLPQTFDLKKVKNERAPNTYVKNCMICESEFKALLNKNPIRHCKRCAKAVCKLCSDNKKQLSKDDPTKYRVCDECDTILENYELQYEHQ